MTHVCWSKSPELPPFPLRTSTPAAGNCDANAHGGSGDGGGGGGDGVGGGGESGSRRPQSAQSDAKVQYEYSAPCPPLHSGDVRGRLSQIGMEAGRSCAAGMTTRYTRCIIIHDAAVDSWFEVRNVLTRHNHHLNYRCRSLRKMQMRLHV